MNPLLSPREPSSGTHGLGWIPYAVPYFTFLLTVEVQSRLPPLVSSSMYWPRAAIPLALLLFYASRRSFPELSEFRPTLPGVILDILFGIAIAGLWTMPYLLGALPVPDATFDPNEMGKAGRQVLLALRLTGFAFVTPFVEELFIRSFLMRITDVFGTDEDFRAVPMARFTWRSFLVTVAAFTVSHARWQWPVAAPTGIAYNLWLYQRRHLGSVILTHCSTNLSLFLLATLGSDYFRGDLWFLL